MKRYFFIAFVFCSSFSKAQDLPPDTQQQLENLSELNEVEVQEDDNLLLQLDYFRKNPLDLNTATQEDLRNLRFLTDLQVDNFVRYRGLLGHLLNIYELQAVPSWDLVTIKKILPYVTIGNVVSFKESLRSRFKGGDQSVLFRMRSILEKSRGYDTSLNTHYLGTRHHVMVRYRYQFKNLLYYGVTADKDPGEQFLKGAQAKGFDFYSFHFFARRLGHVKALAIGDYSVNLGQGLIHWQSLGFGKSSDVASIKRQSPVLAPYRSAGEFYFNRGAGITMQKGKMEATAFVSYRKISGNVTNDTALRFSSLVTSGYHRTTSEVADRNNIGLTSIGGNVSWQPGAFKLGWNAVGHRFSIPIQKRDVPYNNYAISGRALFNSSVDYNYTYKNIHVFGEVALDQNRHTAFLTGVLISVDPKVDLSFLYRNLQKEYQSLFGNAFTENSSPGNEKGAYAGVVVRPVNGWQLNAYADFFQFPWLRFRVNAPSKGYDYLVQLNYQPNKQFEMYARYRNKNKPLNGSTNTVIYFPEDQVRQNLRVHFLNQLSSNIFIRSRLELLWLKHGNVKEEGFLGYVEAAYKRSKLAANLRLQFFQTGSYDSRIYTYESDVLYAFSIPAFYDKGLRYYLNLHYQPVKNLELWLRWARTVYADKMTIGSGLDEINGNRKTELKWQVVFSF